jgi:hypothetical protein
MSAAAYVEGDAGDSPPDLGASPDFLKWKSAQIAVTRQPACIFLAVIAMIPVPIYFGAGGGSNATLERFVGFRSLGASSSLGLCILQTALYLLMAYVSIPGLFKRGCVHPSAVSSSIALSLLAIVVACPSCLLSFAAAPAPHGVTHPAIIFAITSFLTDPGLSAALPAAAVTLASNACFLAYAPRDTAVYQNFM